MGSGDCAKSGRKDMKYAFRALLVVLLVGIFLVFGMGFIGDSSCIENVYEIESDLKKECEL